MKKALKIVGGVVAGVLCFSAFGWEPSKAEDLIRKEHQWHLPALTQQDRAEKINKDIKPYQFRLLEASSRGDEQCRGLLDEVKSISLESILQPVRVDNPGNSYWSRTAFKNCPDLDVDREYHPSKKIWDNMADATNKYSFYYQGSANREFYDLSGLLGDGIWAVFEEGGIPNCRSSQNQSCINMQGYETLGKVLDVKSCRTNNINMFGATRLRPEVTGSSFRRQISYSTVDSFFAFLKLKDNRVVRLIYKGSLGSNTAQCVGACGAEKSKHKVYLDIIVPSAPGTGLSCVFLSN